MSAMIQFPGHDEAFRRIESPPEGPVLGQWYWYTPVFKVNEKKEARLSASRRAELAEERTPWLGCAMKVGSNYVELQSPHSDRGHTFLRVHLKDFWTQLRHEPDADAVIRKKIAESQDESLRLLNEVKELTMRLGMSPAEASRDATADNSNSLMVLSETHDVKAYGRDLVRAKTEQLPAMFEAIKEANQNLATWMKAPSMPMIALLGVMQESVEDIDQRIFAVSLYAGIAEEAVQCCPGAPAAATEKLRVFQRLAYMDEECLADYRTGGMTFEEIEAFDAYISTPENRDRLLPFPRCLLAMRVRRNEKERDCFGDLGQLRVNIALAMDDKLTFLFIRNGDQVWRISCDMEFGPLIFPDRSVYDPLEPKMVEMWGESIRGYMSVSEWESRKVEFEGGEARYKKWAKENPKASWIANPHREYGWAPSFRPDNWFPVDHSNVYFDDVMADIGKQIAEYNRVALIIQGLFDRSLVLHPHPPAHTWTAEGFDKAVELVYDGSSTIAYGEPPDFEEYRAKCNATIKVGSLLVGQDDFWQRKEAIKEGKRRDNDWRDKSRYRPTHFVPYGNPGPGYVAQAARCTLSSATFEWEREGRSGETRGYKLKAAVTVPKAHLFNIDAYRLGDFKRLFADSRTRMHYLKWAPLLIAAEEYHSKGAL